MKKAKSPDKHNLTDKIEKDSSQDTEPLDPEVEHANIVKHFKANFQNFVDVNKFTKKELADKLGCNEKTISSYLSPASQKVADPKYLAMLKKEYDISLDDFLFAEMTKNELLRAKEKSDNSIGTYYKGLYIIYYLSTESFKGSEFKESAESLQYGILYVYDNIHKSASNMRCLACLGIESRKEISDIYDRCEKYKTPKEVEKFLEDSSHHFYKGYMKIEDNHYYINLFHRTESVLMIGYSINVKSKDTYIGGLVTVNSISRGRENAPVMQLAGLSRYFLNCNEEELEAALHMHYKIEIGDEADRILGFVENAPGTSPSPGGHRLSKDQRKAILIAEIEYEVRKIIEKRVYRHYKMLQSEDSLFYHYLNHRRNGASGDSYGKGKY